MHFVHGHTYNTHFRQTYDQKSKGRETETERDRQRQTET